MYSEMLQTIEGVTIFPIISLVLFFAFFVGMLIKVFKMDKNHLNEMSRMPLNKDPHNSNNGENSHVG